MDVRQIIQCFMERKPKRAFIYPYGNMGYELRRILTERVGFEGEILCVDDYYSQINGKVFSTDYLKKVVWTNDDLFMIASSDPFLFYEIRIFVEQIVPKHLVVDCFGENSFVHSDNPRVAALSIAAREIYKNSVRGNVAEAGVYKGEFAKFINVLFPYRQIYLFDPFEGFRKEDITDKDAFSEDDINRWYWTKSDTSEKIVMNNLRYPNNAIIRRGYVPESLEGVDDSFAFVSLDMDLYYPTYEALKFFWPMMSPGGYIFVHDVDNLEGCGKAVREFCKENGTGYVCLNDCISAAIVKPLN